METDPEKTGTQWTPESLRAEVAGRTWFHQIDLGDGVITPGADPSEDKLAHLHLPADLTGKSVIDIGAVDGFFSFAAERRGAARVLASDSVLWRWPGTDFRRNFELAHEVLGSSVESQVISVEDISPESVGGPFDIVLFLGVLYHAPDPLGYLRRVRSITGEMAVIETHVDLLDVDVPAVAYYEGEVLNADGSNFFGPNIPALRGMLADAGFGRVEVFDLWSSYPVHGVELSDPRPSPWARLRRKLGSTKCGRVVVHAFP